MKKFGSVLLMSALFTLPVLAQEDIPMAPELIADKPQVEPVTESDKKSDTRVIEGNQTNGSTPQVNKQSDKVDYPNLGRRSTPLSSLVITPPPLPKLEIDLGGSKKTTVVTTEEKPATQPVKSEPSAPIAINKNVKIPAQPAPALPKFTAKPKPKAQPQMPKTMTDLFAKTADVKLFNLSGFELGMIPEEVLARALETGWKIVSEKTAIPLFRESFYEQHCRAEGARLVSDINDCITQSAQNDGQTFINEIILTRPQTRETISVLFTSNATDNLAYKIFYQNLGDNSLGFTPKNMAAKLRRKEMFWNQMFEAYGYPDDAELILWGDLQKAYMQATMSGSNYDAYVSLEDKEIQDYDYFEAEDAAKEFRYPNQFTFIAE